MKDEHSVEEQLDEMKAARGIVTQLSELVGHYMQGEMNAQRNPADNEIFKQVCFHVVELEAALNEMVQGLTAAQAIEEAERVAEEVTKKAIKKTLPPDPNLPF